MRHLVLGTAGHIDHGKTALVKALTGVDTDRLPEEKARGISIDLGFSSLSLPSGEKVAIVDVPGHERFIKNMLAGATGMDAVLLVIAADEGVMPQTREHLDILRLLRVHRGIVVITKVDLVDAEWLQLVEEDVRQAVQGSFLEDAPVVCVSSVTGRGLDLLLESLEKTLEKVPERARDALPRLPVDRTFTVAGFGTVVTGTLHCGELAIGDKLELVPPGLYVRVRGLEVHGHPVECAGPGQRVAVNLAGVEKEQVQRGHVLTWPGFLRPVRSFTASMQLLENSRPLANGARVRLHLGTAETIGRIILLDGDELGPGSLGHIRFRAESPLVAFAGDRYIVRTYSPIVTIGGGVVLDTARRYRRLDLAGLSRLDALARATPLERVFLELQESRAPLNLQQIAVVCGRRQAAVDQDVAGLVAAGRVISFDDPQVYLARSVYDHAALSITGYLGEYFQARPFKRTCPREETRHRCCPAFDQRAFNALLRLLQAEDKLRVNDDGLGLPGRDVKLDQRSQALCNRLLQVYSEGGFSPPALAETLAALKLGDDGMDLVEWLIARGDLVKAQDVVYHRKAVERARELVLKHFQSKPSLTPAEFRDMLATTRKYAMPLLAYFDDVRLTRRVGDERTLYRPDLTECR
ncbi:MAG: selenocysteine-specific translation elongation factor [Bacillota bacterium]